MMPADRTRAGRGRWRAGWLTVAGALATGMSLLTASPASAGLLDDGPPAGSTANGYQVAVTFSGNAAPGGGSSSHTVSVEAACWWGPATNDQSYTSAEAMLAWYRNTVGYDADVPVFANSPKGALNIWEEAVEKEKDGTDISWYRAYCRDPADYGRFLGDSTAPDSQFETTYYRAYPVGVALPPPMVRPEALAAVARDAIVIPDPLTDRNPKINGAGAPTLVGLPTWFWVTDPAAVGGAQGTRTIRAQVGAVWAEVTATTGGLQLSSPAGGTTCPPGRATTKYAEGVPDASACTIEFSRASVAYSRGYPVIATTGWQATWTGSDGTTGVLDGLTRTVTANVPVAEVQNVVTGNDD